MDRTLTESVTEKNPGVLMVSDDRGTIIVLRALLERLGAEVRVARSAREAADLLDWTVSWVIMDPGMEPEERVTLMARARDHGMPAEFIIMTEMRDIEGVLEVMGYPMAA